MLIITYKCSHGMDILSVSETYHQELPLVHHLVAVCIKHIESNLKASMGLWRTETRAHRVSVCMCVLKAILNPKIAWDEVAYRQGRREMGLVDKSIWTMSYS